MRPYSFFNAALLLFLVMAFIFSLSDLSIEARKPKKTPTPSPSATTVPEADETLSPSDLSSPSPSPSQAAPTPETSLTPSQAAPTAEPKSSPSQAAPTPEASATPSQAAPTAEPESSPSQAAPKPKKTKQGKATPEPSASPSQAAPAPEPKSSPAAEGTPEPETTAAPEEKLPIPPVEHSSILFTIDYRKVTRDFTEDSVALSFSDIAENGVIAPEKAAKLWDVMKESGYRILELRLNPGSAGLIKNKDADPSSADRYDFTAFDEMVKKAASESCRLLITIELTEPPSDINSFSKETDALLKHILQGWAGGFNFTDRDCAGILFDFRPDLKKSAWSGRESEYSHIYSLCAKSAKKLSAKVPVGGPGFYAPFTDETCKTVSPHVTAWLDDCVKGKVPVDFLFCRQRGMIPYGYFLKPRSLEQTVLNNYKTLSPLNGRPRMLWRADTIPQGDKPLLHGTVAANALMCLIKGGADLAVMSAPSVEKDSYTAALQLINVFREMPVQLETVGLDRMCFILMACKSRDDRKACFVFSANNPSSYLLEAKDSPEKTEIENQYRSYVGLFTEETYPPVYDRYRLNMENLPWKGEQLRYRRFVIEGSGAVSCIEDKVLPGAKELYFNEKIKSPALQLILLEVQPREGNEEKPKN